MIIIYKKNCKLEIYSNEKKINFDINKSIDIENCRDEYNKIIDSISARNSQNIHYLTLKIIERNTIYHKLFEDLCLIRLVKKFRAKNTKVYTNNISLFLYFKTIARYTLLTGICFQFLTIKEHTKPFLSVLKLFIENIKFYFLYAKKKYRVNLDNKFIIFSFVTDLNFSNKKIINIYDSWFHKYLKKKQNYKIKILLYLNLTKSKKNILKKIRLKNDKFIIIHDYLNFKDFFFIFKNFFCKRQIKLNANLLFFNIKIDKIFRYYLKKENSGIDILYYKFFERIYSNNIKIFLRHENNIIEKAMIFGIKKFINKNRIFGYFQTTNPKNLLNHHYTSQRNFLLSPKPDIFLFNSNKYKNLFKKKYKDIITYNFPALDQLYLGNAKSYDVKEATNTILVFLTGDNEENKFIIHLINELNLKYIKFLFRTHPFHKFNVKKYFKGSNYLVVNNIDLTNEIFLKIRAVVSGYSAVMVEFSLRNFPIGFIYNKASIIKNPFDFTDIRNYHMISTSKMLLKFFEDPLVKKNKKNLFNLEPKIPKVLLEQVC